MRGRKITDLDKHFWSRVDRSGGADACWPWVGGLRDDGYGVFWTGKHMMRAHVYAFMCSHDGPTPEAVLHGCDNPPCCNPKHLEGGTQTKNLADMTLRGRRNSGKREAHGNAKLSEIIVAEIRARYRPGDPVNGGRAMAREFGVHDSQIGRIARNTYWVVQ